MRLVDLCYTVTALLTLFRTKILKNLSDLEGAPSVGMQDVPRESVGSHLGFQTEFEPDELDKEISRRYRFGFFRNVSMLILTCRACAICL